MTEYNLVKKSYEKISEHFHNTRQYQWKWIIEFHNEIKKNSLILDVGCGNGRNMKFENQHFIGIDNCHNLIKICKEQNLNVILLDMCKTLFLNNSFDYITMIASFHHLSTEERRLQCLNEMYRILKSDGVILLSVWSINQPKKINRNFIYGDNIVPWNKRGEIIERYYYIFKINEIKNLFQKCKFKIKKHFWDCGNEIFLLVK